jgi:hypothetical protein
MKLDEYVKSLLENGQFGEVVGIGTSVGMFSYYGKVLPLVFKSQGNAVGGISAVLGYHINVVLTNIGDSLVSLVTGSDGKRFVPCDDEGMSEEQKKQTMLCQDLVLCRREVAARLNGYIPTPTSVIEEMNKSRERNKFSIGKAYNSFTDFYSARPRD